MLNLIRAEWFKLSHRPLVWVLLAVFLALMLPYLLFTGLVVALADGLFSNGATRVQLLRPEQIEQFRLMLRFPGIFGTVLGQINSVGGICAIVLAAGAFGSEYGWGTLRAQLARQPDRSRYLLAKLAALLLIIIAGMLIALAIGSVLALLFSLLTHNTGALGAIDLIRLPLGMLRALYVMLPYMLCTLACSIVGRSVLAGAAGGFLFLVIDLGSGALAFLADVSAWVSFVLNLFIQQNINTLIVMNSHSFGLDPAILSRNFDLTKLPSPLQATVVVAVYCALFLGTALHQLRKRDITGPG